MTSLLEFLSEQLQPYKDKVAFAAGILTIANFFSGALLCKKIYARKTTEGTSSTPFIGSIAIGIMMVKYGMMLEDETTLVVNYACIFLNAIYTLIYLMYTPDKVNDILKPMGYSVLAIAVVLGYSEYEDPDKVEYRYGMIITILMLALLASPLMDLKDIMARKDASVIPFPMTAMVVVVSLAWLLYGIILMNYFMIVQNVIGLLLGTFQLILIFMYPGNEGTKSKDD